MRTSTLFVVGILLIGLGSLFASSAAYRSGETEYTLNVSAPYGVAWTLYIPKPATAMEVAVGPFPQTLGTIDTFRGLMDVLSGSGPAYVHYRLAWSSWRATPLEPEGLVDLGAREGSAGFWVFRLSGDSAAAIEVQFAGRVTGRQWGSTFTCGGPSFQGAVEDGWTLVPAGGGDCVVLLSIPPLPSILAFGGVASLGGALIVVGARRRLRSSNALRA